MPDEQGRYTVLALGDSVVWGQGLRDADKFTRLVTTWIGHQKPKGAVLASLARSGAILDTTPTAWNGSPKASNAPLLQGEVPRSDPSIRTQLEIASWNPQYRDYVDVDSWDPHAWAKHKRDVAQQLQGYGASWPDLILLDGGINDFDPLQVALPWVLDETDKTGASAADRVLEAARKAGHDEALEGRYDLPDLTPVTDEWFKKRIDRLVYELMKAGLERVVQLFPRSRVVVTGYFPIFTRSSAQALAGSAEALASGVLHAMGRNARHAAAALLWALHPSTNRHAAANRIVDLSTLWARYSAKRLQDAINAAGANNCVLAVPDWDDHGALTSAPWLWTFGGGLDAVLWLLVKLLGKLFQTDVASAAGNAALDSARQKPSGGAFTLGYALGAGFATDDATLARWLGAFDYYVFSSIGSDDQGATLDSGLETSVTSVGHPNPSGDAEYARAIQAALGAP